MSDYCKYCGMNPCLCDCRPDDYTGPIKPARRAGADSRSSNVRTAAWLAELDELYKRYRELEKQATWGGSFEREYGAARELKPVVNKMFDTLLKLLQERSASDGDSR